VAVVYAQNPEKASTEYSGDTTYDAAQGLVNPATAAAMGWSQHLARYGPYREDALGQVVVAARRHARLNPNAVFRDELTLEDYLRQPEVLTPFRALDICKLTAGGYCIILARADLAQEGPHPRVLLHAIARHPAPDPLSDRDHLLLPTMRRVADQVYAAADCGPADIDYLSISDGHSPVVLMTLEQYGFCEFGDSADFAAAGEIELGGKLPINVDGGQLSCAYSIGFLHQVEMVRQLRGECGERQVEGARIGQYATTGNFRQEFLSNIYIRA
jgi:acetyl-CoA acetyltransferase